MKVTRVDLLNAIWHEVCEDRGFSREAFISDTGEWQVEESFDGDRYHYKTLRKATLDELELDAAMDVVEGMFSGEKAFSEVDL